MALTQKRHWILCSKKMPPKRTKVLVAIARAHVFVAHYDPIKGAKDSWWFEDGGSFLGVVPTHWMAFPSSPCELEERKRVPQLKKKSKVSKVIA